jgi:hypothetical protein
MQGEGIHVTLDEIQKLCDQATPGPWKLWGMQVLQDPVGDSNVETARLIAKTDDPDRGLRTFNASFIAEARTYLPRLLAVARAAKHVADRHNRWLADQRNEDGSAKTAYLSDPLLDLLVQKLAALET